MIRYIHSKSGKDESITVSMTDKLNDKVKNMCIFNRTKNFIKCRQLPNTIHFTNYTVFNWNNMYLKNDEVIWHDRHKSNYFMTVQESYVMLSMSFFMLMYV